jgi:predicted phage gp36 major capsid-like protein
MATKKRRITSPKQKPITAKRVRGTPNLCEVAERLEVAKKEIRDRLREIEEEERESGGDAVGSKEREKLEAVLRALDELIHPIPPIHIYC